MKYTFFYAKKFKKGYKKISKNPFFKKTLLENCLQKLASEGNLKGNFYNHKLQGKFEGCFECHIQPDVLLIYEVDKNERKISLLGIGSHADLFG